MGEHCEKCLPLFVGSPSEEGGRCVPCREHCSGHADRCYDRRLLEAVVAEANRSGLLLPTDDEEGEDVRYDNATLARLDRLSTEGPTADRAVCLNCHNATRGPLCRQCVVGTFRGSRQPRSGCQPCHCNRHGDLCNPVTGGSCQCGNHTETDAAACSAKSRYQ